MAELLTESLKEFRCADGSVLVSRQYLDCLYFVETLEISAWPSAQAYWASHGISLPTDADAVAERCAIMIFIFYVELCRRGWKF